MGPTEMGQQKSVLILALFLTSSRAYLADPGCGMGKAPIQRGETADKPDLIIWLTEVNFLDFVSASINGKVSRLSQRLIDQYP